MIEIAIADDAMYRKAADIVTDMLSALTAAISDVYVGEDGAIRIIFEIEASQLENVYLGNQLLLEDSFPTTATYAALRRHGEQYGLAIQDGTLATGSLKFTGGGGTYIGIASEVAYDPGAGLDPVYFETNQDGTIPDPGIPSAPVVAVNVAAGNLNGLYEYVVTFVNASGETLPSPISAAVNPVTQKADLSAIPIGGPGGTTARRIYRAKDGSGIFRRIAEIADNTTVVFTDNVTDATMNGGALVPTVDTAHSITLTAQAQLTGIEGNVAAGVITELTNVPATLTDVTNTTPFTGGSDPEGAEDFRARILSAIQNPQTGSPSDLKAWAENVPGVGTATVFPNTPGPGQVTIRITGESGSTPTPELISEVEADLVALDLANVTLITAGFTAVPTNVTVDVTTDGTFTLADVTPQVQTAISNYTNSLDVGETFKIAGVIDAVFGLAGIADVVVTTPATNQVTASDSKRTPGVITVT